MPMSCDTMPVVWTRMRSSSVSRTGLRPATTSPLLAWSLPRGNSAEATRAGKLPGVDHVAEFAHRHVAVPVVDHGLVETRPAGRVHLAPRERHEGGPALHPWPASDAVGAGGSADRDVGAAHHVLDAVDRAHRDAELLRPFGREG